MPGEVNEVNMNVEKKHVKALGQGRAQCMCAWMQEKMLRGEKVAHDT